MAAKEQWHDLMEQIDFAISAEGTGEEKAAEILSYAEETGHTANLHEFLDWFDDLKDVE